MLNKVQEVGNGEGKNRQGGEREINNYELKFKIERQAAKASSESGWSGWMDIQDNGYGQGNNEQREGEGALTPSTTTTNSDGSNNATHPTGWGVSSTTVGLAAQRSTHLQKYRWAPALLAIEARQPQF